MQTGNRVGQYEIETSIGSGGMGEVFRAVDIRLRRTVAIKFLSNDLADAAARQRFQLEAQTASSLNHPHILTVHDAGEHEGRQYLVTEFVDGGTFQEWLARGNHSWREAIELLAGVADGLASAHAAGVLHRDIKPGNILISTAGYAKLADFGLAKLIENGEGATGATRVLSEGQTRTGIILGTVAYMSPEQASGKPLDARSDIFSFGVVLYEALTTRRPFAGATDLEILQSITYKAPENLDVGLPVALRLLVEKAMEKDPAERYQSMREVVVDLRRVLRERKEPPAEKQFVAATPPAKPRKLMLVAAAALILAALGFGALGSRLWNAAPAVSVLHQERLTEIAGMEETPAISHDGKTLAFVASVNGKRQIFARPLAKGAPVQITREDVDHSFPRWADENTLIYFLHPDKDGNPGSLWETVVLSSAPPRLIGSSDGEGDVSRDSRRIATFRTDAQGPMLVILERDGRQPETVRRLPNASYSRPRWSPDNRSIAFEVRFDLNTTEIRAMDLAGGEARTVLRTGQVRGLTWLHDGSGFVYASSEGSTMSYPPVFSLRTVSIDGKRRTRIPVGDAGYESYVEPDITATGKLVASRVRLESDIFRFPVDGTPLENVKNARQITHQTGQVQAPSASPDGLEVAYISDSGGHSNIWVASVNDRSAPARKITDEQDPQTIVGIARWSPVGDQLVYIKQHIGGDGEEWLVNRDGTGHRMLVRAAAGASWSRDGKWIYYNDTTADSLTDTKPCSYKIQSSGGAPVRVRCDSAGMMESSDGVTGYFSPSTSRQGEVWRANPIDTGTAEPVIVNLQARIPLWPHHYDLSTDGLWLATPLKDNGTTNLWAINTKNGLLRRITDFQERATLIGRQVSWSNNGKYIFAALLEMDADVVLLDGALAR